MKLERLDIRVLSGLEEPFTLHFEPDAVNFITGPNASGKSSVIRAVRALLYPDQTGEFCHIRGRWRIGDRILDCERHGTAVTWLDGTTPAPPPRLPGGENTGAYLISSEDLTRFGDTESHIVGEVRTMLAGGYDLDAVLAESPLVSPARPQKLAREHADMRREIEEKEDEYAHLNDELATLARLTHELETTADAAARLRACEDAVTLAEAIARRNAIEHTLIEEFPGGMDRLRGDELTRLDQIESRLEERRKEKALTEAAFERAEKKLEETGSVDPQQMEAFQSSLSELREALAELERRIEEHETGLEQARRDHDTTAQRLGAEQPELDRELGQEGLEQLERLVDRVMNHREKIRTLTAELARIHVPHGAADLSPEKLHQARQALRDWLELSRLSPLEGLLWGGLGGSALLAAWRLLGPQDMEAVPELVLLILLAAGIPLALLLRFFDRYRTLRRAREEFDDSGVEGPLGWTESEVESRLQRLDQELEASTHQSVRDARAREVRERLNEERSELEQARDKLARHAAELGLSAEHRIETGFLLWCRHLYDWQQASRAVVEHEQLIAKARERHRQLAAEASDLLERHGFEDVEAPTSRSLSSLIHQLGPRIRANSELHNEIRAAGQRLEELDADIEQLLAQHKQIYSQAGIKVDERETLVRRVEQFEEWRSLEQQRRDRSLEVNRLENRLGSDPELLEQAREQQHDALEKMREELGEQAAKRDELNRRIATLHTRHDEVVRRRELEAMSGELEQLRQALSEALDAQLLAGAGQALIEDVRRAHQADNEPAALSRATRWFERFTHHHYRLSFAGDSFEAFDNRAEKARSISELSTATRAQLLLALRLAWIEQAELNCEPLPVFMDEVLTTSDPERYRQVVESVQEIAGGGRQMFYLTAQGDEVTAWSSWTVDGPAPHTIDMAEVRRGQVQPLKLSMPREPVQEREIPDPGDLDPEQWAREAGIGAINPWQGSGMISVFHLLHDDLDLAARLIRAELSHLGELASYLDAGADASLIDEAWQARLNRRAHAAGIVLEDWRRHHDRPVDAPALHAFGLITDTFMPRVLELLESVGGSPRGLIDGLREGAVARFRSDVTDQLEQWLADNGYLSPPEPGPPVSAAELASRTGLELEEAASLRDWIVGAIDNPLDGD